MQAAEEYEEMVEAIPERFYQLLDQSYPDWYRTMQFKWLDKREVELLGELADHAEMMADRER